MALLIVQIIGLILGLIGTILTIVVTAMSQWKVSYMVEGNVGNCDKRIDGQWLSRWDGLWLTCITKNRYNMECNKYESLIIMTNDLKAGRVLMSFAIVLAILSLIIALVALIFVRCCQRAREGRRCLLLTAGVGSIMAGLLVLVPIVWTTVNLIQEINNPVCRTAQRVEFGEAIFLGWPTIFFLLVAGAIFCWSSPCDDDDDDDDDDRCKTIYTSQQSLPRPVYVPCETQEKNTSRAQAPRSLYI